LSASFRTPTLHHRVGELAITDGAAGSVDPPTVSADPVRFKTFVVRKPLVPC